MDILLDTAAFLWIVSDPDKLSLKARKACEDSTNRLILSAVSSWEITVKYGLQKLQLPDPPETFIQENRKLHNILTLPLFEEATLAFRTLKPHHADPFDRMLICQAMTHDLPLLTSDKHMHAYKGVRILW